MNFDNLINKKIRNCFVPADQMSITFVMDDGFRRSLGIQNAGGTRIQFPGYSVPPTADGSIISSVTYNEGSSVLFLIPGNEIALKIPTGASLVELPE